MSPHADAALQSHRRRHIGRGAASIPAMLLDIGFDDAEIDAPLAADAIAAEPERG